MSSPEHTAETAEEYQEHTDSNRRIEPVSCGAPLHDGAHQAGAHHEGAHHEGAHHEGAHQAGAHQAGAHHGGAHQAGAHQAGAHQAGAHQAGAYQVRAHQATENGFAEEYSQQQGRVRPFVIGMESFQGTNTQLTRRLNERDPEIHKLLDQNPHLAGELHLMDQEIRNFLVKIAQLDRQLNERDLEIRKLRTAEKALAKLQDEVLSSVDRFQPAFDTEITKELTGLESRARLLISSLAKQKMKLSPDEWQQRAVSLMWKGSFGAGQGFVDFNDKEIRRKALKNVLWTFLHRNLFRRPFMCFGGRTSVDLDVLYGTLYPQPHKNNDSAKWRAMTVQQLIAADIKKYNEEVQKNLDEALRETFCNLGYDVTGTEPKKMSNLLLQAITFAQLVAGQRAIFCFFVPGDEGAQIRKGDDDTLMTNVDTEFPEVPEELAGDVWFVVKPGLAKWGTGTGEHLDRDNILVKSYVELVN